MQGAFPRHPQQGTQLHGFSLKDDVTRSRAMGGRSASRDATSAREPDKVRCLVFSADSARFAPVSALQGVLEASETRPPATAVECPLSTHSEHRGFRCSALLRYTSAVKVDHPPTAKCFFVGWLFGWVTAIYVPSLLIALTGLSPLAGEDGFLGATLAVADEVAPAAKLGFAVLMAAFVIIARRVSPTRGLPAVALSMLFALTAMLLVLAVLPQTWSRGFGIGLTGTRFAPGATLIYVAGALLSGLIFALCEARCSARTATASN